MLKIEIYLIYSSMIDLHLTLEQCHCRMDGTLKSNAFSTRTLIVYELCSKRNSIFSVQKGVLRAISLSFNANALNAIDLFRNSCASTSTHSANELEVRERKWVGDEGARSFHGSGSPFKTSSKRQRALTHRRTVQSHSRY